MKLIKSTVDAAKPDAALSRVTGRVRAVPSPFTIMERLTSARGLLGTYCRHAEATGEAFGGDELLAFLERYAVTLERSIARLRAAKRIVNHAEAHQDDR